MTNASNTRRAGAATRKPISTIAGDALVTTSTNVCSTTCIPPDASGANSRSSGADNATAESANAQPYASASLRRTAGAERTFAEGGDAVRCATAAGAACTEAPSSAALVRIVFSTARR
jgi:hypothetical protein